MSYFDVSITEHSLSSNENKISVSLKKSLLPITTDNQIDSIELESDYHLNQTAFPNIHSHRKCLISIISVICTPKGEIVFCKSSTNYFECSISLV